jgi:hypothetical protein
VLRTQFNNELSIYSKRGFDLFGTFPWLFGDSSEKTVEMVLSTRPNKPTRPDAYAGVTWAQVDSTNSVGMGNFAAGELTIDGGGKSFGVLGQGNGDTANGFTQNYEPTDKSQCKPKFLAVTVISLADQGGSASAVELEVGSYAWSSIDFRPESIA